MVGFSSGFNRKEGFFVAKGFSFPVKHSQRKFGPADSSNLSLVRFEIFFLVFV